MAPSKHTLSLTNGAAYILEGCLQDAGPCTTPSKTTLWSTVWDKVRKSINRMVTVPWGPPVDMEKSVFRKSDESELDWKQREAIYKDAIEEWQNKPCVLVLSDKHRDAAREAVKYVIAHQNDPASPVKMPSRFGTGLHQKTLLIELGLSDEESESDTDKESKE